MVKEIPFSVTVDGANHDKKLVKKTLDTIIHIPQMYTKIPSIISIWQELKN